MQKCCTMFFLPKYFTAMFASFTSLYIIDSDRSTYCLNIDIYQHKDRLVDSNFSGLIIDCSLLAACCILNTTLLHCE